MRYINVHFTLLFRCGPDCLEMEIFWGWGPSRRILKSNITPLLVTYDM